MRPTSRLLRCILLLFLLVPAAFPARAQSWLYKAGGIHGKITSAVYTPDSKNTIFVLQELDDWYDFVILQHTITATRTDTLLAWHSLQSFRPVLSPDGSTVCFLWKYRSDSLVVWSLQENKPRTFLHIDGAVAGHRTNYIAFNNNGTEISLILTRGQEVSVERRNAYNGVVQHSFPLIPTYTGSVSDAYLSDDGETVILRTTDTSNQQPMQYLELWRTKTGEHITQILPSYAYSVTVSGQNYAFGSTSGDTITVRDIYSNTTVAIMEQRTNYFSLIEQGQYIAGYTNPVKDDNIYGAFLFDIQQQAIVSSTPPLFRLEFVHSLYPHITVPLYSPNKQSFAAVSATHCPLDIMWEERITNVGIYNSTDGTCISAYPEGHTEYITDIKASPDGIYAASAGNDQQTLLWNVATGSLVGRNYGSGILAFSNDATTLFRASETDRSLEAISIPTMATRQRVPLPDKPKTLHTSPDNSHLLYASANILAVYTQSSLHTQYTIPIDTTYTIADAGFSATGDSIVAILLPTQYNTTLTITTWKTSNGERISSVRITDTAGFRPSVLLLPNARYFTALTTTASVHRTGDGEKVRTLPKLPLTSTFDGKYLLYDVLQGYGHDPFFRIHVFHAASVDMPSKDFVFDVSSSREEELDVCTILPSGNNILYTVRNNCRYSVLFHTNLREPNLPRLLNRTINLGTIRAGFTAKDSSTFSLSPPLHTTIRSMHLSDSSVLGFCSITYNRTLPDTIDFATYHQPHILSVSCSPIYSNPIDFAITVYYAGYTYTDSFTVRVVGTVLPPNMSINKSAIDFGPIPIGSRVTDSLTITNSTQASLYISAITIDDPDDSHRAAYSIANALPLWLPPGGKLPLTVSYLPTSEDSLHAFLVLNTNDTNTPVARVPLIGKGIHTVDVPTTVLTSRPNTMSVAPNPASSMLHLRFTMDTPGTARVQLFSAQGTLVRTWLDQPLGMGTQQHSFSVEGIASGVYYCVLTTPAGTTAQPVVVAP